jgi:hypothetical protein
LEQESEKRLGAVKSWGRYVIRELSAARRVVTKSLEIVPANEKPSRADVYEHARPHMAILVHKRAKVQVVDGTSAVADKRWSAELDRFALNFSHLAKDEVERARLIELLDQIVAEEQSRLAPLTCSMPVTSRFDSSWAI